MANPQVSYVLGFSCTGKQVVLISKARPAWQAGRLNGVGGKVEEGESNIDAMVREYFEETGVETDADSWIPFGRISGETYSVDMYLRRTEVLDPVESKTDEAVYAISFDSLFGLARDGCLVANVPWLLSYIQEPGIENRFLFLTEFS